MNIFEALKKDHKHVKELLNRLIACDDSQEDERMDLVNQIKDDLIPHARSEEAVFYNPLRAMKVDSSQIMHSYKEHMEAEALLRTLQVKDKVNLDWKKTAIKLKDALDHHISEEENVLFPLAQLAFTEDEAIQIGDAFEKMKPEIKGESFVGTTLDMIANLMPKRFSNTVQQRHGI